MSVKLRRSENGAPAPAFEPHPRSTVPPPATWPFVAACLAALLLVLGAYSNSLHNAFHFDDSHVIEQNLFIRDIANIPRFFTDANTFSSLPQNATYRPVVSLTLAVDYWVGGGLEPLPFHITQLLLLALVGAMLVLLFLKLFDSTGEARWHRWAALFAATLFCVHTANTQTGNYISARSELLAGLGVLGAFLVYMYAPRWRRYHLYLLPVVFGALAKTPAVMFAPLFLVYKLLIEEQLSVREVFTARAWPRVRSALASSAPAFVVAAILYLFVESMNPPGQTYGGGGRLEYLITQTWVWVHYVRLFFLPTGLTADTDLTLFASWRDPRIAAGLLLVAATLWAAWRASTSRIFRPVAFGIAWFWIALIPSSSIFPLAEVANDHRIFFPFMGLALAAVWWAWVRLRQAVYASAALRPALPAGGWALCILVLAAHAIGTYQRNRVWLNDETLWADVVQKSPSNGRGLMNYGLAHMRRGNLEGAKELFTRAQAFSPNYSYLEVNLGIVNDALGDAAAAEPHFERALALEPDQPAIHLYYARWLVKQARAPQAIPHLQKALALSPGDIEARQLVMSLYAAQGAAAELGALALETLQLVRTDPLAQAYANGTLPFAPESPDYQGWFDLGFAFTGQDRHTEAAQTYRAALAADPSSADAWNNLGWSLGKLGFFENAVPAFEKAIELRPDYELARNNLAWARNEVSNARFRHALALQRTGQMEGAVRIYRELIAQFPAWSNAHYNLAHALMTAGNCVEAVGAFEKTLALQPGFFAAHLHLSSCYAQLGRPADAARHQRAYELATAARVEASAPHAGGS